MSNNALQTIINARLPGKEGLWQIHLQDGKAMKITARGLTDKNRYVKSVTLNGRKLDRAWISHEELASGGTLVFEMDKRPSGWGAEVLPPVKQ